MCSFVCGCCQVHKRSFYLFASRSSNVHVRSCLALLVFAKTNVAAMALLIKLQSIGSLLEAFKGKATLAKISGAEAAKVASLLRSQSVADWCEVTAAIVAAKFVKSDEDALLDIVAETMVSPSDSVTASEEKVSRTATQQYENWMHHVPACVWESLRGGNMEMLLVHLCKLGLRSPSEATLQTMSLAILHQTEGYERTSNMPVAARLQFLHTVRTSFKRLAKQLPQAPCYVKVLPRNPDDLRVQFPAVHGVAFANGSEAVVNPIAEMEMFTLQATSRMRTVRVPSNVQTLALPGMASHHSLPHEVMAFGQALAVQMQNLSAQVSQMTSVQQSRSLPPLPIRSPRFALPPPPPEMHETLEVQDRDEPKHNEPKAPKSLDDITAAIGSALDAAKAASGGGKESKTKKSKTGSKPKAKASPKDSKRAVAEVGARKRPAACFLFGCPKCRGSHGGCTQCRSPDYTGRRYQK